MWLAIVYNKKWKKFSIHFTRYYSYNKEGETKQGSNTIFFTIKRISCTYCAAYSNLSICEATRRNGWYEILFNLFYIYLILYLLFSVSQVLEDSPSGEVFGEVKSVSSGASSSSVGQHERSRSVKSPLAKMIKLERKADAAIDLSESD